MQSYQRFQHIGRTVFNTSGTNAPRSLSCVKVGTRSAFGEGSHTRAHTPKQGPSLLRSQCGFVLPAKFLLFHRAFIYIHFPVLCGPSLSAEEKKSAKMPPQLCPHHSSLRFSTSLTNGPRSLSRVKMSTRSALLKGSHTGVHRAKHGAFWMEVVSLPSDYFTRFGNPAWPGGRTAYFAAFRSWPGVLQKNAESLRDSDALMRVAAPRRRGPAGLRSLLPVFIQLVLVG